MKLHIEVLQEKVDAMNKERDLHKKEMEKVKLEGSAEVEKLCKIIKTLEEEVK
jgi:hypothetical protein